MVGGGRVGVGGRILCGLGGTLLCGTMMVFLQVLEPLV